MPLTPTHALVPLAAFVAVADRPVNIRLVAAAMVAAALPDLDGFAHVFVPHVPKGTTSIFWHRGATHSLFLALAMGCLAAVFARHLNSSRLTAGVVIAASMASHGLLDMFTSSGEPVAYLWPVSAHRLFADWRPIQTHDVSSISVLFTRTLSETVQLIVPMFLLALLVRGARTALRKRYPALS